MNDRKTSLIALPIRTEVKTEEDQSRSSNGGATFKWIASSLFVTLLAAGGLIGANFREKDREIEGRVNSVEGKLDDHLKAPGHAVSITKLENIEKTLAELRQLNLEVIKLLQSQQQPRK